MVDNGKSNTDQTGDSLNVNISLCSVSRKTNRRVFNEQKCDLAQYCTDTAL